MAVFAKDHVAAFQACPEFLALVSEYPCHRPAQLISPTAYPTFQALESAVGFCLHGCVECVVAPEQNIHGILTAKETVNKRLLTLVRVFLVPDLHAKGVVTPLGIITGSTNITHSGLYALSQNASRERGARTNVLHQSRATP